MPEVTVIPDTQLGIPRPMWVTCSPPCSRLGQVTEGFPARVPQSADGWIRFLGAWSWRGSFTWQYEAMKHTHWEMLALNIELLFRCPALLMEIYTAEWFPAP